MQLTNANLSSLSIPVPSYDRSQVRVGIVHFGVGGFHALTKRCMWTR